jgi:hypothetical protein
MNYFIGMTLLVAVTVFLLYTVIKNYPTKPVDDELIYPFADLSAYDYHGWLLRARNAWLAGDENQARLAYQKFSYNTADYPTDIQKVFKDEITAFVKQDSVYNKYMPEIQGMLKKMKA